MTYAAWSLFALVALADWVAVARGDRRAEAVLKPAATLALIAVPAAALVSFGEPDASVSITVWLFVALFFGLLGDIALLSDSIPRFKLGLAAFLVGHLAYLLAFLQTGTDGPVGAAFTVLFLALVATRHVLPEAWRMGGPTLAIPVAAYTLVIGAMLFAAFGTGIGLIAVGASIFVASDSILSVNRFVRPLPRGHLMVMVTYHVGQALIVAGLLS
ncbi:lysoplasmalogenase [Nocardioides sp.]|uniref:lysoplasmalogenase n=1 Tax=Nocardioides sp. TaxID=35761 RepID=UPI002C5FB070|nr:lysoplasmalogenase [Nocardioides sp.]HSX67738.1 lysoplasmalogenase [Nocardioides sp.]